MPLVRTGGTKAPDERPEFWQCWRQLGHAVVVRAVYDYCMAQKKVVKDKDGYHYANDAYEKFFRSKYFSYICPDYSGPELLEILESGGWKNVRTTKHFAHSATYQPKYVHKADRMRGQHG